MIPHGLTDTIAPSLVDSDDTPIVPKFFVAHGCTKLEIYGLKIYYLPLVGKSWKSFYASGCWYTYPSEK
jgi:hypothetical protein